MIGKQKCKILKEIRQRIADENDIPYVTRECSYQGECSGTCPRCESELRYLEKELARRKALGKRISVAAVCVGIGLAAAGCSPTVNPEPEKTEQLSGYIAAQDSTPTPDIVELSGDVALPDVGKNCDSSDEIFVTTGEVAWPEPETESVASNS